MDSKKLPVIINGEFYSRKEFDGYKIRALVQCYGIDYTHTFNIYTSETHGGKIHRAINQMINKDIAKSFKILNYFKIEQDKAESVFVDEFLKGVG